MQNQFLTFFKKARRDIWIKALTVGISAALALTGGLLLAAKLLLWPTAYCIAGIAALPIGAGLFLLFHRLGEKKMAHRLDNEFALHEKVQTMIAFRDCQDPMAQVQRQDTLEKLGQIPTKRLRFTHLWVYILLPVLAAGLMVTAVACPDMTEQQSNPAVVQEIPRDISDWEWQALDDLITWVQNSDADAKVMKPKTLTQLNSLRNWLANNTVTETALTTFVTDVARNIRNVEATAAEQDGITDTQLETNAEVAEYVIKTLYDIFEITDPDAEDDQTEDPVEGEESDANQGPGGLDKVTMASDDQIFDPRYGDYVRYDQVISGSDGYYTYAYNALDDGTLSEQWREFIEAYFGNLMKPTED